jgi:hypothetical protein
MWVWNLFDRFGNVVAILVEKIWWMGGREKWNVECSETGQRRLVKVLILFAAGERSGVASGVVLVDSRESEAGVLVLSPVHFTGGSISHRQQKGWGSVVRIVPVP